MLNKSLDELFADKEALLCLSSGMNIKSALDYLLGKKLACLPVVDNFGTILGVVTLEDIIEFINYYLDNENSGSGTTRTSLPVNRNEQAGISECIIAKQLNDVLIEDIVFPCTTTVSFKDSLKDVIVKIIEDSDHRVLMTDSKGSIVDLITPLDILKIIITSDNTGEVNQKCCRNNTNADTAQSCPNPCGISNGKSAKVRKAKFENSRPELPMK